MAKGIVESHMYRVRHVLCVLVLLCIASLSHSQGFVIDSFYSSLTLDDHGRLAVQERIQVTFTEEKHGIFRSIPDNYKDGNGLIRSIFLGGFTVTDEKGNSFGTKISHEGEYVKIRIGDPKILLSPRTSVIYVIQYTADNVVNWFDDSSDWTSSAQLYWNVTGPEWPVPIERSGYKIVFPKVAGGKGLRAKVFAGPYGSTNSDILNAMATQVPGKRTGTELTLTETSFSGIRATPLPPNTGMTIVVDVPSALIAKPTFMQRSFWALRSNLGFGIPIVVLVFMSIMFLKYGKDPTAFKLFVRFEPPEGLSGSECGTLIDERVDQRDLAAGIFSLAVKGYLKIIPTETGVIFKKRSATIELTDKNPDDKLPEFERTLRSYLKASGGVCDELALRTHVAPHVGELKGLLYDSLVKRGYYAASPETVKALWGILGVLSVGALAFLCTLINPMREPLAAIIGGIVGCIVIFCFLPLMPQRTSDGARAREEVRAFEEFIRSGKNRTEWMAQKHPDAALFEEYLPHAIAFGLIAQWAKQFEGIMHEMPSWYVVPPGTPYSYMWFASDLGSVSDGLAQAAGTPPRSAGASGGGSGFSSGGGFSGGGFGGGGGGSW